MAAVKPYSIGATVGIAIGLIGLGFQWKYPDQGWLGKWVAIFGFAILAVTLVAYISRWLTIKKYERERPLASVHPVQQRLTQTANPHNEFNPTLNISVPVLQNQTVAGQPDRTFEPPDIEFTNSLVVDRWIHPELGLIDEKPVPDFPFGSSESLEVQVMLARFYYKPDRDVPETIYVKAHIAIADASGKPIHARYDAVWDQEPESEYKTFDTAKTHGLIVALVSADADPKSMSTFEYRERGSEFDPDSHRFEGTEFRLRLELIGKHYDQRVLYKAFDFGLGLVPKPWMKLI